MDYKVFYSEIADWIQLVNQAAVQFGMDKSEFWLWVADSSGSICKKYQDNRLVIKQMTMLVEWLEEVNDSRKKS